MAVSITAEAYKLVPLGPRPMVGERPAKRRRKLVSLDAPVSVSSEESPVLRWLMTDGRRITDPKSFLENFAMRLTESGVDVSRITTGVPVFHPQLYSYSGLWERGKGVTERLYRADVSQDAILTNSSIKSACEGTPSAVD
jgi:hypothetical protein